MSNQPPQGAQQYTAEEAAEIVKRVKAGLPLQSTQVPTKVTTAAPPDPGFAGAKQPADNGAAKEETSEPPSFEIINPPLGVWRPSEVSQLITGYVLAVQVDAVSGAAFYVVQLTDACDEIEHRDNQSERTGVGDHVAVYDAPTLRALRNLMPQYNVSGDCLAASEVILAPHRSNPFGWDYLVQARRVLRPAARRPGFACVPDALPQGEIVDGEGVNQRPYVAAESSG